VKQIIAIKIFKRMKPGDFLSIALRLTLALFVGALIGLERETSHKPAGLRTHMLVSLGSALFILASLKLSTSDPEQGVSRTIQGIAAGIGFLGGGEIIRSHRQNSEREEVHGLTSAAAIWVSAALGTMAGCGLWELSLLGAMLSYVVLKVVKKVERYL
jgi:putative Mg2+ transporter-C (MgtC) family protein